MTDTFGHPPGRPQDDWFVAAMGLLFAVGVLIVNAVVGFSH